MKVDVEKLHEGLVEYREGLKNQSDRLAEDVESLTGAWRALDSVYGGESGQELLKSFLMTMEFFQEYVEEAHRLGEFLDQRIEELQKSVTT